MSKLGLFHKLHYNISKFFQHNPCTKVSYLVDHHLPKIKIKIKPETPIIKDFSYIHTSNSNNNTFNNNNNSNKILNINNICNNNNSNSKTKRPNNNNGTIYHRDLNNNLEAQILCNNNKSILHKLWVNSFHINNSQLLTSINRMFIKEIIQTFQIIHQLRQQLHIPN